MIQKYRMDDESLLKKSEIRNLCWVRDNYKCQYCGREMKELYSFWITGRFKKRKLALITVDHIVPLSKGGTWKLSNLVTCCSYCNLQKGSEFPEKLKVKLKLLDKWWRIKKNDTATKLD